MNAQVNDLSWKIKCHILDNINPICKSNKRANRTFDDEEKYMN